MSSGRVYNRHEKRAPFEGYPGPIVQRALQSDQATAWANERLPDRLLELLDLASGDWVAPLPEGMPDEQVDRYDIGVLPEPPVSEWSQFDPSSLGPELAHEIPASLGCSVDDLIEVPKRSLVLSAARWIVDHLTSSASALAAVREMNTAYHEPFVHWTSVGGVFYPVAGTWDRDNVADLMDFASSVYGEFVLLTSLDQLDPTKSGPLGDREFESMIARSDSLILGAYDGEGYIRWCRHGTA